jgi:hypothetical protein
MAAGSIGREWGVWGGVSRETIPNGSTGARVPENNSKHSPAA